MSKASERPLADCVVDLMSTRFLWHTIVTKDEAEKVSTTTGILAALLLTMIPVVSDDVGEQLTGVDIDTAKDIYSVLATAAFVCFMIATLMSGTMVLFTCSCSAEDINPLIKEMGRVVTFPWRFFFAGLTFYGLTVAWLLLTNLALGGLQRS